MADMHKVSATNVTDGPKVLNSTPAVIIPRGGSTEGLVEITAGELKSMRATGYFDITGGPLDHDGDGKPGGSEKYVPPALTGKNKAELLDIAKAEDVDLPDDATNDAIRDAIEAKRNG